jgi:hypothetical protein
MGKFDDAVAGARLLLVYWRVPVVTPPAANDQSQERTAAKILALLAVVALGISIRGRASAGAISAAAIPTVAAAIAGGLDSITRRFLSRVHDGMVLPVYVTTPLIMFGYLVSDTVLRTIWSDYDQLASGRGYLLSTVFGTVVVFVVLLFRSFLRKTATFGLGAVLQGAAVALLSGAIVYLVAKIPVQFS